MTGMTPPVFTFSGMCVLAPPYIRRPTMRRAYCTVTRRCPRSTNTTAPTTATISASSSTQRQQAHLAGLQLLERRAAPPRGSPTTMPA